MNKHVKTISCIAVALVSCAFLTLGAFALDTESVVLQPADHLNGIVYSTESVGQDNYVPEFIQWNPTGNYGETWIAFEERETVLLGSATETWAEVIYIRWGLDFWTQEYVIILAQTQRYDHSKINTFYIRGIGAKNDYDVPGQNAYYNRIAFTDGTLPSIASVNSLDMGRADMTNPVYYNANYVLFGRYTNTDYSRNGMFLAEFTQDPNDPESALGSWIEFIYNQLDRVLSTKMFGWFTVGSMVGVFVSISAVLVFLKYFAGG